MGHVLNNTIQDILARKARMDGKEVLWLPGTDHAGIATQMHGGEERSRKQGEIKHRDDLGREEFLEKVWEWKEKHGGIIIQQLKKLGCSCDWTRERFTMDPEYSRCVQKVFVDLYKKGLIYRGKRMVNWCPASQTALSDEEVEMKAQKGFMYYFKVEVAEAAGHLSDHRHDAAGNDSRRHRRGGESEGPALRASHRQARRASAARRIAARAEAHPDHRRRACGFRIRHRRAESDARARQGGLRNRPAPQAAGRSTVMNAERHDERPRPAQDLTGLDRFEARKVAVEKLTELGALEKEEPYENNVGYSERADVPIEPRLSEQWFLKYPSVEESKACVAKGEMKFHPERWAKVYDHWMSEHPGLVHQPPALVGASDSGVEQANR